ncbi:PAS domain-containing sensor histidine kinase [Quatrionicoccus australiensis]|uniref:PAS domain-containing sensor histidine kinase n=1 Tax=Quatrionicoccus australiensis TaxID=138118 RepID=UPI001CF9F9D1|nr:PAS domain-containing sensor histidine kinase [Quatrionicoccus australiensis]MCB4358951.1 response regulator [Quatrionicoccus australiensis]
MKIRGKGSLRGSVLAIKILLRVMLTSFAVFSVATLFSVVHERGKALETAHANAHTAAAQSLPAISIALWQYDIAGLNAQLSGMVRSGSLARAEVRDLEKTVVEISQADFTAPSDKEWSLPILAPSSDQTIGFLHISESYAQVNAQLVDTLKTLVLMDILKIIGVSLLLFTIVYRMITRHLHQLAEVLTRQGNSKDVPRLVIDRKATGKAPDEIDILVDAINRFVSDRKRGERDLESILNNMPAMIGYWDKSLHNRFANSIYAKRFGVESAQMAGKHISEVTGEAFYQLNRPRCEAALRGEPQTFEHSITIPDSGRSFDALINYIPDRHGETVDGFYVLITDVSSFKQTQAELERHRDHLEEIVATRTGQLEKTKAAAEAANIAKSSFLANMSHEIRTPLNAIIGMVNLMRRAGVAPEQGKRLEKIDTASHHLLELINAILDLSKIEAGKFSIEESNVSISSVSANVASILNERASEKGLSLIIDNEALPTGLRGDSARLQQALLNYATNAVKFTDKGSVTLRTRVVEDAADSVLLRFEVEDTGIGIAPETLPRLFTSFEQADNTISRNYGGSGLGLAITKRLAQIMGGEAGVESTPGVGSTFWLTARLKKGGTDAAPEGMLPGNAETLLRERHASARILIVDDEPINQEVAQMLLEDVGLTVETAADGIEAIARVQKTPYALVLMDMQMPHLDGLEATRQLRQLPATRHLPIIAMTANAFAEDRQRCFEAGMNDYLAKPFNPEKLYEITAKWLSRHEP